MRTECVRDVSRLYWHHLWIAAAAVVARGRMHLARTVGAALAVAVRVRARASLSANRTTVGRVTTGLGGTRSSRAGRGTHIRLQPKVSWLARESL